MTSSDKEKTIPDHAIMKIVLTAFLGAQVKDVINENGDLEKCVCIPLDRNGLVQGRTGKVSAYAFVNRTINSHIAGWTHYIRHKASPEWVKKMKDLGFQPPYIGNLKPSNYIYKENAYYKRLHEEKKVKTSDFNEEE